MSTFFMKNFTFYWQRYCLALWPQDNDTGGQQSSINTAWETQVIYLQIYHLPEVTALEEMELRFKASSVRDVPSPHSFLSSSFSSSLSEILGLHFFFYD